MQTPKDVRIDIQRQDIQWSSDGSGITVSGSVGFALSNHVAKTSAGVALRVRYKFLEDGNAGEECDLALSVPAGFAADPETPVDTGSTST